MFENLDDPKRQALLALAAGLLSPVRSKGWSGFGEALGQGIQGGLLGFNQAQRTKEATDRGAMARKLQEMQFAEMERAQKFNQAAFKPGIGAQPLTPNDDNGFPMPSPAPRFDYQAASQIDPAKAFQMYQQFNPQPKDMEVGGRVIRKGPDGSYSTVFEPPKEAPKPAFQPGQTRTFKSGRVEYTQEFQPDGTWKQIGKSAIDKPESGVKAPPQGYEWGSDGKSLRPIPGGPADQKVGKEAEAAKKREEGALARVDVVLGAVKDAVANVGFTTAGWIGGATRGIPGSPAYNLNRTVDTIKANIGFQELQAMREASPTGGALGQVAVQELNMLQSVLGSLDTAQNDDQLLKSLYAVEKHFNNWKRAVAESRRQDVPQGGQDDPLGLRK